MVADAAGIDEPQPIVVVDVRDVRVPVEQRLRAALSRLVGRAQQRGLHAQRMPVAEQHAAVAEEDDALALLKAAEVAVARHLLERDAGVQAVQRLRVAPAVAEVNDGVERGGALPLHGADHVVLIAVGVGKKKNFHSSAAAP